MPQDAGSGKAEAEEVKWEVRPLSAANAATYDLALKTNDQTVPLSNDFLQKMVALDAALIGGGFVVAKGDTMPVLAGGLALACLLASLGFAVHGLRPMTIDMDIHELGGLGRFKEFRAGVVAKKNWAIRRTIWPLLAAFAIAIIGFVVRGCDPQEPKPTRVVIERPSKTIDPFEHVTDNRR